MNNEQKLRDTLEKLHRMAKASLDSSCSAKALWSRDVYDICRKALALSVPQPDARLVEALLELIPHDTDCALYNIPIGHECDCKRAGTIAAALSSTPACDAPTSAERKLVEWVFDNACVQGGDVYGADAQEKLLELGLIERRPTDPDTNDEGAEWLYFLKEPASEAPLSQVVDVPASLSDRSAAAARAFHRDLQKMRETFEVIAIENTHIPEGCHLVEAYETPTRFVIIGEPHSSDETHNCDAMGCSTLSHVVATVPKPPLKSASELAGGAK